MYYQFRENLIIQKLNNLAVEKAQGQILLLLNNDIEAINQGWFEEDALSCYAF